jgi:DNA-binding PadR family transcriptional regulator
MERELKRGTLEMVLLKLLREREMYGYELVTEFQERGNGEFQIKDGTLYPVLYRLEKAGHVEPRWETQERGVPRKYYRVTAAGRKQADRLVGEWRNFVGAVESLLNEEQG